MRPLIYIAVGLALLSCQKDDEVVKEFELDHFKKIEFNDSFTVVFHTSSDFRIVAKGSERFIEEMKITSAGDSVLVENDQRAAWLRPESNKVRLDIYCDSLFQIKAAESCDMTTADTLRSENLIVIVGSKLNVADLKVNCSVFGYYNVFPCSGVMSFSGKTEQLNIWNEALMEVDASNLSANRCFVQNNSAADCKVRVSDELRYSILNRGNIVLNGSCDFVEAIDESGEGELIVIP
jgi:hypothetical protein